MVVTFAGVAGCGGSDDAVPADQQPGGSEATDSGNESATTDDTEVAGTDGGPGSTETSGDDTGGGSNGDLTCDEIFTQAEIEEFFGEPAQLSEETTDSIGQLVCDWETIEDPDNLDDLAASIVLAQVFSGDPVPAENFIDPDFFDDVTMLEGFGDVRVHHRRSELLLLR